MPRFTERLQHAWNAFFSRDPTNVEYKIVEGGGYSYRPDRRRMTRGNERSIVTAVINRIAIDTAAVKIQHVRIDQNERYKDTIDSGLNNCLTLEANLDQTGRAFITDIVMSMLDEGVVAAVPVETSINPRFSTSFDIQKMRVGKIVEWYPQAVKVRLYNEANGKREDITLPKRQVAIIENPLYAVMNEPNSTLQRLIRKLNLLDVVDEQSSAGKLDLIIQLPYVVKTESRRQQAEKRRKDIEDQLAGSKYGIAYTDGTERITQLNRPIENNLQTEVEYLTKLLLAQLGITQGVLDGSANDAEMINYRNRIVEPILAALTKEMARKFLSKNARTRGETVHFFPNAFNLVTVPQIAEIASTLISARVLTANEGRQLLGLKPSSEEGADTLSNPNIDKMVDAKKAVSDSDQPANAEGEIQNEET